MIVQGDARALPLAAGTVQCVVTSPPYWGLRDYGTARWEGGDPACDHKGKPMPTRAGFNERYFNRPSADGNKQDELTEPMGHTCSKCGARRVDRQLGLESTPDAYVASLVAVFREVWRVLRDDGTLWLNLGDSYASNWGMGAKRKSSWWSPASGELEGKGWGHVETAIPANSFKPGRADGLKVKDLVGIPWRVAFALQADGWYLRQDIIWAKPNPMPESVRDRCTKAHEYVFLLTKRQRYYYDAEAIAEESTCGRLRGPALHPCPDTNGNGGLARRESGGVRNRRSVWTVNTQPYPEAHFATFPEKLVEPCILAGTKPGDLVMDPFAGSGTVGAVCRRLARKFVGVELNSAYVELAVNRLRGQHGLPLEMGA